MYKRDARFRTDLSLLNLAGSIPICVPANMTVLYAEESGKDLAARFVTGHPGHLRLDDVLQMTHVGRQLQERLRATSWSQAEEVWWELSRRMAATARGVVNVFGPPRLIVDRPLTDFRHQFTRNAYANTVFEKVELPELEQNHMVSNIYYNGFLFI